jgi:hypothetical protein
MPSFNLSTLLGLAVAAGTGISQAFPHTPWGQLVGAAVLILGQEIPANASHA